MTDVAHYMNAVAVSARLHQLIGEFEGAVAARDPRRIAMADHALRSAALAVMGSLAFDSAEAPVDVDLLQDIVDVLRRAAARLAEDLRGPRASLGQLVYMRLGTEAELR